MRCAHGVLSPPRTGSLAARLLFIHDGLARAIEQHHPDAVSIEEVFYSQNIQSALTLGHARGVAMLAAARAGLEVAEYAPATIKQAVVGTGRAEKQQVSRMVSIILGMPEIAESDASDALAIAITHVTRGAIERLKTGATK